MRSNVSSLALTSVQLGCDFDSRFFIGVFGTGTPTERPDSETATLCQPVMPVGDGLGGRFVRVDCTELGKRHGHIALCQRISTNISWVQESSGANRRTSAVSPLRSGETGLDAMHRAVKGNWICFSR